jgi:hypothetical protein
MLPCIIVRAISNLHLQVSGWYTREELGLRLGIFFCAAMLSGAFGGLFAAGIAAAFANNALSSWRYVIPL